MARVRINKFIAGAGICSRRKADEHIRYGHVLVNGEPAAVGMTIDPATDQVTVCGKPVSSDPEQLVYYALYKPTGVISTASDPHGRPTVTDLVPDSPRVYPVGRLDIDSEGLILLTNDGQLAHELMHPSFEHEKEYEVLVHSPPAGLDGDRIVGTFTEGIEADGELLQADQVSVGSISQQDEDTVLLRIILHTGYNRQIRRMCEAVGLSVIKLRRVRIGKLRLESLGLRTGEYREIDKSKVL